MSTEITKISDISNWNLQQVVELGAVLAKSGYFKDVRDGGQAVVKILYGQELGVSPIAAMRGVFIDERGGISLSAGLISAMILRSGTYLYKVLQANADACEIEFLRDGETIGVVKLTMAEARTSKMNQQWSKDDKAWKEKHTWNSYPSDMLFARTITRGARRFCPDVFLGPVYVPDELDSNAPYEVVTSNVPKLPAHQVDQLPAQAEATGTSEASSAPSAPGSGRMIADYAMLKTRTPVAKCAILTGQWAAALADILPYYGHANHALNAAKLLGYTEITDANAVLVAAELRVWAEGRDAEKNAAQA